MLSRAFLLLLSILFSIPAWSQDVQQLQLQLANSKNVEARIHALDALANYYTWSDGEYEKAKVYGSDMIAAATQSGDKKLLCLAYILNGIRLVESIPSVEREKDLRGYFANAIREAKENGLPFYEACAYVGLSGIPFHGVVLEANEELGWGQKAFRLATEISNDSLRAMSLVAMSMGESLKDDKLAAYRHSLDAVELAEKIKDAYLLAYCYRSLANFYSDIGNSDKAILYYSKAINKLNEKENKNYRDLHWIYMTQWNLSWAYNDKDNISMARASSNKCIELAEKFKLPGTYKYAPANQLISFYTQEGKYDDAYLFIKSNPEIEAYFKTNDYEHSLYQHKAVIYQHKGMLDSADYFFHSAIASIGKSVPTWASGVYVNYGRFLFETGKTKEAIQIFEKARIESINLNDLNSLVEAYKFLDDAWYKEGNVSKAYQFKSLFHQLNDSLLSLAKEKELAVLQVLEDQKQIERIEEISRAEKDFRNSIRIYGLLAGLAVLLGIAIILFKNNRQKNKTNALLKEEKNKTEQALQHLTATQSQLIQSEKMASLGELTAGIAHEIQNPLNFVNNFSEVNRELLEEMNEEISNGNYVEVRNIVEEIKVNEALINLHGKRADGIVKSMLQHSHNNTGKKELTDINKLADEYLRLAYHGMRSKDKNFNATLKTDFENSIGDVSVVPQDIGRVLLNLYNNAFYSMAAKVKKLSGHLHDQLMTADAVNERYETADKYEPTLWVSTKRNGTSIEITVKDNGNGIPEKIVDKVFQPFFTTKPTGEGTGLGLSLAYDIIKAHQGEVSIKSHPGSGVEFKIILPVQI